MRHLKLTIAYDGTNYVGWQVQDNGITVQQRLEEAWTKVTGEKTRVIASGRTDSGVHALAQVCSVATDSQLTPQTLVRALNAESPYDIAVLRIDEAVESFHAIRDAVQKTYCYHVQYGRIQNPLRLRTCWFVPGDIDLPAMKIAAGFLIGEHDFASFEAAGAERKSTVRDVKQLDIEPETLQGLPGLKLTITANGFLYNMVRNIVGTLVQVGRSQKEAQWVEWVREQKDRTVAGQTAPAHALFLKEVVYRDETIKNS